MPQDAKQRADRANHRRLRTPSVRRHPGYGSIEWNRTVWDDPSQWERDGNHWDFHADACGQPYEEWRRSTVETFLQPFLGPGVDVIEIGSGHGRWSEFMAGRCRRLTLMDVSPSCVEVCRRRFGDDPSVLCVEGDGRSIPAAASSADLVWSFGTFVHMDRRDVESYLADIHRVLRPGGQFLIHHSGWPEWTMKMASATWRLGRPGRVLQRGVVYGPLFRRGSRMPMSRGLFRSLATRHGLDIDDQVATWGAENRFGLAFRDVITLGSKPSSASVCNGNARVLGKRAG